MMALPATISKPTKTRAIVSMLPLLLLLAISSWLVDSFEATITIRKNNFCRFQKSGLLIGRLDSLIVEEEEEDRDESTGIRLNKAFRATHSRRQADTFIADGRVRVNGKIPSSMGVRLFPGDIVTLDGLPVQWERLNQIENVKSDMHPTNGHTYIKYWKPRGIECTTDRRVSRNIMDALGDIPGVSDRLFPMGRLDKDSSGLILITSDGATTQRVLKSETRKSKTYLVETDKKASRLDLETLANGVQIMSFTSRDGVSKRQMITTQPAIVERGPNIEKYPNQLLFQISEGKNRQIRRMCETLGLTVVRLHRISFCGITLDGCPRPGTWTFLTKQEIQLLKKT